MVKWFSRVMDRGMLPNLLSPCYGNATRSIIKHYWGIIAAEEKVNTGWDTLTPQSFVHQDKYLPYTQENNIDLFVYKTSSKSPMHHKSKQRRQKAWSDGVAPSVNMEQVRISWNVTHQSRAIINK